MGYALYWGNINRIGRIEITPKRQHHPCWEHFKGIIVFPSLWSTTSSLLINPFPEQVQKNIVP